MELPLSTRYSILERLPGHVPTMGKSAGEELNWAYRLIDNESEEQCIGMFCKPNHIVLMDKQTWDELTRKYKSSLTWYIGTVGYAMRTVNNDKVPFTYLHQLITNHLGNGKGKVSVDHNNQNKLDNRSANLRIVEQCEQNRNRGKVARHANAKELPKELNGKTLPKFCVYYKECYNKEKNLFREFFTIEGHPNLEGKRKVTSKSNKLTILEKLQQAKDILYELDNGHPPAKQLVEVKKEDVPIQTIPFTPPEPIPEKKKEETLPSQWKVSNIYTYLTTGKEELYRTYVKENNPNLSDEVFNILLTQVKEVSKEDAEKAIKEFIVSLRTVRHNGLCHKKNDCLLDREDREVWRAETILRALHAGRINDFKSFTETAVGDSPEDPKWCKRWGEFLQSLQDEKSEELQKRLISKFLAAQRTKKLRRKE